MDIEESGSTDYSLVPQGLHEQVWAMALWFHFGHNSGTSLGFAALSLQLTGKPLSLFACPVSSTGGRGKPRTHWKHGGHVFF